MILTDIEFSDSQNLDQALWKNVFYQVIERFRQLLKDQDSDTALRIKAMLLSILEEVLGSKCPISSFLFYIPVFYVAVIFRLRPVVLSYSIIVSFDHNAVTL